MTVPGSSPGGQGEGHRRPGQKAQGKQAPPLIPPGFIPKAKQKVKVAVRKFQGAVRKVIKKLELDEKSNS